MLPYLYLGRGVWARLGLLLLKTCEVLPLPLHCHPSWPELWEPLHALASMAEEASG